MTHPPRSMMEYTLTTTIRTFINMDVADENHKWLGETILELVEVAGDHPGVVNVINRKSLKAMEAKDGHQ